MQPTTSNGGGASQSQSRDRAIGYALVAVAAMGWGMWPLILKQAPMAASLQSAILITVITVFSFPIMLVERAVGRGSEPLARNENERAAGRGSEPLARNENERCFAKDDEKKRPKEYPKERPKLVHWIGVGWLAIADALNVALFFAAYQRTTVAIAVLTHYLTPVFVALAAPFVLGERLRGRTMLAVAISFAGLILLLEPWRADLSTSDVAGAALGAGSAVFYASNVVVSKRLFHVFSASELMFFHCLAGLPLLWLLVPSGSIAAASPTALGVAIAGSIGPGAIGGMCFVWGLRRVAASHASILTLLEPFVAVLGAALVLGQRVGLVPVLGGLSILIGAMLVITLRPKAS